MKLNKLTVILIWKWKLNTLYIHIHLRNLRKWKRILAYLFFYNCENTTTKHIKRTKAIPKKKGCILWGKQPLGPQRQNKQLNKKINHVSVVVDETGYSNDKRDWLKEYEKPGKLICLFPLNDWGLLLSKHFHWSAWIFTIIEGWYNFSAPAQYQILLVPKPHFIASFWSILGQKTTESFRNKLSL